MPYKEKTIEKLFWSIGEVAAELDVNTSLIRYWEKEFSMLRPRRSTKGDRLYTAKEIDQLRQIHHLVKERGFTLNGARESLRRSEAPAPDKLEVMRNTLLNVREQLVHIRRSMEGAGKS